MLSKNKNRDKRAKKKEKNKVVAAVAGAVMINDQLPVTKNQHLKINT